MIIAVRFMTLQSAIGHDLGCVSGPMDFWINIAHWCLILKSMVARSNAQNPFATISANSGQGKLFCQLQRATAFARWPFERVEFRQFSD